jgi:hypothetical protein
MAFFCQSGAGRPTELQYVVETVHREPEVPLALAARTGGSERGSWLGRKRLAGQRRAGHKLKETDMESPIQKHSKANGEQIARLAYGFWEQRGRPSGRDVELWLQAERQLANPNMPPATRIAPVRSSDAGAQARRPAEEKSAGWPSASAVKGAGRSSAKSTDSRDKARVFRAAAA